MSLSYLLPEVPLVGACIHQLHHQLEASEADDDVIIVSPENYNGINHPSFLFPRACFATVMCLSTCDSRSSFADMIAADSEIDTTLWWPPVDDVSSCFLRVSS